MEEDTIPGIVDMDTSNLSDWAKSILRTSAALKLAVHTGVRIAKEPVGRVETANLIEKFDEALCHLLVAVHHLRSDKSLALKVGGTHLVLSDATFSKLMELSAEQANHRLRESVEVQVRILMCIVVYVAFCRLR